MQIRLLNLLRCPLSGQSFQLTVEEEISVERNGWSGPARLRGDHGDETREILTGWLITDDKKYRYPIVRGVPRMLVDTNLKDPTSVNQQFTRPDGSLSREYQQTIEHFRTQWEAFAEEEKTFGMTVQESWEYFLSTLRPPDLAPDWFKDKLFVDAGSGHGKYVDALSAPATEVIGFDITPEIERVYLRIGNRPNVNLIQANILHPPQAWYR